jgi:hypothetical protein
MPRVAFSTCHVTCHVVAKYGDCLLLLFYSNYLENVKIDIYLIIYIAVKLDGSIYITYCPYSQHNRRRLPEQAPPSTSLFLTPTILCLHSQIENMTY